MLHILQLLFFSISEAAPLWVANPWTNCKANGPWVRTVLCVEGGVTINDTFCANLTQPPTDADCTWSGWSNCGIDANQQCSQIRLATCLFNTQDPSTNETCPGSTSLCDSNICQKGAPDLGTRGLVAGIISALVLLTFVFVFVSCAWCRHDKRYLWAHLLTPAEKIKRLQEERETLLNVNHNTDFKQQRLSVWTPKLTYFWTVATYLMLAIWCLPVGVVIYSAAHDTVYQEFRYDNQPGCDFSKNPHVEINGSEPYVTCTVGFNIEQDMSPPIFMYYKISPFYQNHRSYVQSRDEKQIRDASIPTNPTGCYPLVSYSDYFHTGHINESLRNKLLYPCGLIAQTFFTDIFYNPSICPSVSSELSDCNLLNGRNWQKDGIAWASDLERRFINRSVQDFETNMNPRGFQMPPVNDEDFVVWMRTSPWESVTKLHRQILDLNLTKGSWFNITLDNKFPSWQWGGEKYIVLATVSFVGGGVSGKALGLAHIVAGGFCLLTGLLFYIKSLTVKAKETELSPEERRQKALEASLAQDDLENPDGEEEGTPLPS